MEKNNTTTITIGVVALVIGGLIGFGISSATAMNTINSKDAQIATLQVNAMKMQNDGVMVGGSLMVPQKNIVQNAVNADNVTTVVAAVQAAGLAGTLESTGPFTVFAPDNDAFNKLPSGTVQNLLLPENKAQLVDILTYHVVKGHYTVANLYNGEKLTTVEGKTLTVTKIGDRTMINNAVIQTKDIISSNGVTHVIDSVLLPPSQ